MRKTVTIGAGALALGLLTSVSIAQDTTSQQPRTGTQIQQGADRATDTSGDRLTINTGAAALPSGFTAKEADDAEDVRDLLGTTAEAAVTQNGFDDLVERLVDQDRNRIGDFANQEFIDLNNETALFNQKWNAKYGKDFNVDHRTALKTVAVIQGEVSDSALAMQNWPVNARGSGMGDARPAAGQVAPADPANPTLGDRVSDPLTETATEKANLEKGREVAIATFPVSHGKATLNASILGELQAWRIDIPNNLTGPQLRTNLVNAIRTLNQSSDQWPADMNDASAAVTHHLMLAIYNAQPQDGRMMNGSPQTPAENRTTPAPAPQNPSGR